MKKITTLGLLVCLVVAQVHAQYAVPPTKGKKHRTTTTTTEAPGALSNEISGPFPVPDSGPFPPSSFGPSPNPDPGSYAFSPSGSPKLPGSSAVTDSNYWWQGPDSPFKPGSQPAPGCGGPGGCGPPPPPSGGCGGPAGCTGVATDPRPSPAEPPGKPVDIAQNPFLSSAILGKPIPQSFQGCEGPGGSCQYPSRPMPTGTGPTQPTNQFPGQPGGSSSLPGQSASPTQFFGSPTIPSQYPGEPAGQYPGQPSGQGSGQYPGQPTGQPSGQPSGKPTGQYPGQPSGQFPGQPSGNPTGQYPGQPSGQYPGQPSGNPIGQYPSQPSGQYPGQPSGNPTGQYPGQPSGQYPEQPSGNPTGRYPGQPSGQYPGQLSGKPIGQYPGQQLGQYPGQPSGKPTGQFPGQPSGQYPGQPSRNPTGQYPGPPSEQFPGQPSGQYPEQTSGRPTSPYSGQPGVPLRPRCTEAGHACVPSSECVGGFISPAGMRHRKGPQVKECIPGLEACCKVPPQTSGPNFNPVVTPTPGTATSNRPYTGPLNTTPYPGCAAALKCVVESYCTADGVMADHPVTLTREQAENKVPLTDCQDLETGIIGKCCRDPNYKDPWPAGMMMMKNPGDFDDGQYHGEGSVQGVNIGPSYNSISSTPQTPAKDHGPKPSDGPGGFNKPFPPPFSGNTPSSPSYNPGRPVPNGSHQSSQLSPSINPYQPGNPSQIGTSSQPGQPKPFENPYQPGKPGPSGSYQPGQPFGIPYQPGHPSQSPNQPSQPFGSTYNPDQPSPTPQVQPPASSFPPGQPSQPNPTQPFGSPYQPDQPPGSQYQPFPSGAPSQPDASNYNLPTHPGQNQPFGQGPQDQGPAPGSSCGIRRPGPEGDVAGFAEFPWQALLVSAGNRSLLCGAAIIADNAVITSAHCVNQFKANDLLVKAGEWKLLGQNPKQNQVRPVVAIARHPGYNSNSLAKDLAILILAQPFVFDVHVDKICIPPELGSEYFQKPEQNCLITGWGKNALQGPVPNSELHKVNVDVITAKQCEAKLKTSQNLGKYFILNEGFSCALPPSPTDLCKVDIGSAVACAKEDGHYELAGVNSWDIACPTKQPLPTVFATSDAQWISTVLSTPTPVLKVQEDSYNQELLKGESVDGVDVDDKPGFSQGYGK